MILLQRDHDLAQTPHFESPRTLLFLFLLTLLPFTTQLIGTYRYEPQVIVIYGLVKVVCGCSLAFMWWGANRLVPVVWPRVDNTVVRSMLLCILLGPLFSLVAIAVAFLNARLSHVVIAGPNSNGMATEEPNIVSTC